MRTWKRIADDSRILWLNIFAESDRLYGFSLSSQGGFVVPHERLVLHAETYQHLQKALAQLTNPREPANPEAFVNLGRQLFDQLLPEKVQEALCEHKDPIILVTEELSLPWELLHDHQRFLCLEQVLARKPEAYGWADSLFGKAASPALGDGTALIIADPAGDLPSAAEEGDELKELFRRHGVPCDYLVGRRDCTAFNIMTKLGEPGHAIVHFAGHTRHLADRQTSAIVLADNDLLLAQNICRGINGNPVAFLNACHCADVPAGPPQPARFVGPQNVRTMVQAFATGNRLGRARAVIGSMWWVSDEVARGVAAKVYEQILQGVGLGESLRRARSQVAKERNDPALWSCYVLFGEPLQALLDEPAAGVAPAAQPAAAGAQPVTVDTPAREGAMRGDTPSTPPQEKDIQDDLAGLAEGVPWSDDVRVGMLGALAAMSQMNWPVFSTFHLLMGLTYLENGLVSRAFRDRDLDPNEARRSLRVVLKVDKKGPEASGITFSDNMLDLLKSAKKTAREEGAPEVTERHLLLAATALPQCGVCIALEALKVDIAKLRRELGQTPPPKESTPSGKEAPAPATPGEEPRRTRRQEEPMPELFLPAGGLATARFTPDGLRLLDAAVEAAVRTNWEEIRSPHLFIGLLLDEKGPVPARLQQMGVPPLELLDALFRGVGQPPRARIRRPQLHREFISDNALKVLRAACAAAARAGRPQVDAQDVLTASLSDPGGYIPDTLRRNRVDVSGLFDCGLRAAGGSGASNDRAGRTRFGGPAPDAAATIPVPVNDNVHFAVTSPPVLAPASSHVIDVWAYLEHQRDIVIARAQEEAGGGEIRIKSKGPVQVARGTVMTVRVRVEDIPVEPLEDTILWDGEIGNANFAVTVPADLPAGPRPGTVSIFVGGFQIARLAFMLQVGPGAAVCQALPTQERRVRTAFISYASEDEHEVLARVQGMRKAMPGLDVFFPPMDMESGEKWKERLQKEILERNILYLFWSKAASISTWVDWEWRYALKERGLDFISPCPLVRPQAVPPPAELADKLHFDDWELAFMAASRPTEPES